jgi:Protein of unknown function (DUF2946)
MCGRRSPLAFWLAVIATVFNVLWPLLAQARVRASVLVPVCTIEGVTHYIELPTGKTPLPASAEHKHCSLCTIGAQPTAPQAAPRIAVLQSSEVPARIDHAPAFPSAQYPASHSRAPPRLSNV